MSTLPLAIVGFVTARCDLGSRTRGLVSTQALGINYVLYDFMYSQSDYVISKDKQPYSRP